MTTNGYKVSTNKVSRESYARTQCGHKQGTANYGISKLKLLPDFHLLLLHFMNKDLNASWVTLHKLAFVVESSRLDSRLPTSKHFQWVRSGQQRVGRGCSLVAGVCSSTWEWANSSKSRLLLLKRKWWRKSLFRI